MIPYTINGEEHYLPDEELQAVEMSGRSRWQDYAMTPGEWPAPTVPVCPLMDARPGAVEPMDHAMLNKQSRSPYKFESLGYIHYRPSRVVACYKSSSKGFGAARFANFIDHPRVCTICLNHYLKGA